MDDKDTNVFECKKREDSDRSIGTLLNVKRLNLIVEVLNKSILIHSA